MKIHRFLFLFSLLLPFLAQSQSSDQAGILPSININKKLPKDWSVNFKTESRQSLFQEEFNYDYLLTDISLAGAKKIGINTTVAAGYLLRVTDSGIVNRTIQQLSSVKRYPAFRVAHRISTDQTFEENDDTEFRFRYRASAEIPLNGESLDPGEYFLKINNEYLNSFQGNDYDLEIRGVGLLGFAVSAKSKLECGLDYRLDSFLNSAPRHRYWLSLNFYQSI
ncbi:DUF2490 domain-containing protein [Halocola ammonii]